MITKMQQRQDQMEDLGRVQSLLIKLQAVFQLPKQLRAAVDQGAIELAVEKNADVAGLLRNYGHKVSSLTSLATGIVERSFLQECTSVAKSLSVKNTCGILHQNKNKKYTT